MRPELTYDHLIHLTTPLGLYEHALGREPRPEHGYCVDDVARALVVTSREPDPSAVVLRLAEGYLDFVLAALGDDGLMHNRRLVDGTWGDTQSSDDHWGRALWALGVAAASGRDAALRLARPARAHGAPCARGRRGRGPWPTRRSERAQLLAGAPTDRRGDAALEARALLGDARAVLERPRPAVSWPWPEGRLTYANAVLPEALLVIGSQPSGPARGRRRPRPAGLAGRRAASTTGTCRSFPPAVGRGRPAPRLSPSSRSRSRRWPRRLGAPTW